MGRSDLVTRNHVNVLALLLPCATAALRLVVTGAAGYLGAEIACLASEQGHHVTAVVKSGQSSSHLGACQQVLQVDDLREPATARAVVHEDTDAVIHAASVFRNVDDMETQLVAPNIELAEQMVCACAAANASAVCGHVASSTKSKPSTVCAMCPTNASKFPVPEPNQHAPPKRRSARRC